MAINLAVGRSGVRLKGESEFNQTEVYAKLYIGLGSNQLHRICLLLQFCIQTNAKKDVSARVQKLSDISELSRYI